MELTTITEREEKKNSLSKIYDSKSSLNIKKAKLSKASKPIFSEGADEIIRLTKVMDSQKALIDRYAEDLKTLKIINYRQEKALKKLDKDKSLAPQTIHTLNEELKMAKTEKARYFKLSAQNEKLVQKQSNSISSLRKQLKDLNAVIKAKGGDDFTKLRAQGDQLKKQVDDLTQQLEISLKKQKLSESEKDRDSKNFKSIISKQGHQIETLTEQIQKLLEKIDEKDKHINQMNIYATHAAERKQLKSRTAQGRAQTVSEQTQREATPVAPESHPHTDALMNAIMKKSNASAKNTTNPVSAAVSPKTIHKPDLSYEKKATDVNETVEDILARRMRDHISINGPPKASD
jgi:hypothetical protein